MKKRVIELFCAGLLLLSAAFLVHGSSVSADNGYRDPWGDNGDGTYTNPVLPSDYSDPDAIRVGEDYYLVTSTFTSSGGVAVLHSADMVNWETISYAIPDVSVLHPSYGWQNMGNYGSAVYAPSIRYHDGMFYVYTPSFKAGGLFVSKAESPEGPWDVIHVKDMNGKPVDRLITDPCPFWDDDGNNYILFSLVSGSSDLDSGGPKGYPMVMCRLSEDGTQLLDADAGSDEAMIETGTVVYNIMNTEASKIYKRNGYYYLFNCDFAGRSPQGTGSYMKRSTCIYGVHEDGTPGTAHDPGKYEIKYLGNQCPLQGGLIDTPDGKNWYWIAQFNDGSQGAAGGRQVHLVPVTWEDDWPVWGNDGAMVWTAEKPIQGGEVKAFQHSDGFDDSTLDAAWQWNHEPRADFWSLTERPGYLRLHAYKPLSSSDFFRAGNTIFQRYIRTDAVQATYKLDISGMEDGQKAGMVHFNGGSDYHTIGVVKEGNTSKLQTNINWIKEDGPVIPEGTTDIWFTSLTDEKMVNTYYYSFDGVDYKPLGDSFQVWFAGYRGNQIGVYNYNDKGENGYIDIDEFNYHYTGPGRKGDCHLAENKLRVYAEAEIPVRPELLKSDGYGKTKDVTKDAQFVVCDTGEEAVFTVDESGNILGTKKGKGLLAVIYEGKTYLTTVTVLGGGKPVTDEDMVLYYTFDETDTDIVTDVSGSGRDGLYRRDTQWAEGLKGNAVKFSGGGKGSETANYVELPNTILPDMKDITINVWTKWDGGPNDQWLLALGGNKEKGDLFNNLFITPCSNAHHTYAAITNNRYDAEQGVGTAQNLEAGEWKMITVSLNAEEQTLTLYENGELLGMAEGVTHTLADIYEEQNAYGGYLARSYYNDPYFGGLVDEFRIYDKPVTDQDVKRLYESYVGVEPPQTEPAENIFEDVNEEDWFREYVQFVYDGGIMTGLDKTHFGPAVPLARAHFAVILHRMNGTPAVEYVEKFPDVVKDEWYTDAILWAADTKIVTGYTHNGMFGPADYINREQMAVMMYRYADYKKYSTADRAELDSFADADKAGSFAKDALRWAVGNGIITGKKVDGVLLLDPQGSASRAECAAIIQRFSEVFE